MKLKRSIVARSVVTAALASVSLPALAQQDNAPPTGDEKVSDEAVRDIIVTGSRVVSNGNSSPSQVTVVTSQQLLQTTPSNLSDAMRKLPQFAGSTSQSSTQGNAGAFSASSFLNLRSIGPVRNLVLFDGTRLAPSATNGAVDINTIPQMLIERVDVVTGGVSAVYGSDAVSGVVNFVVDKKFNGVKAVAQTGISQRGDNPTQRLGVAAGTSFAGGRGHIEASFEYFNSDGIDSNKDRKNGALRYTATGTGTAANPFTLTKYSTYGNAFSFGGHILATYNAAGAFTVSPFYDGNFTADGVLSAYQHGTATGTSGIESGGDGAYYDSSLLASLDTKQGFLRADYELTDSVNVHAQGIFSEVGSVGRYLQPIIGPSTISARNGFLTPALRQQMAAAGVSTFLLAKFQRDATPVVQDTTTRNIFANLGFDGKLGSKFKWSVDYGHNETRRTDITRGNGNNARLAAALDSVVAPSSYTGSDYLLNSAGEKVVCNVTLSNPGLYPGCLPLNVFGPTAEDSTAEAWWRGNTHHVLTQKLDTVSATIHGSLFSLPAGDVNVALNGEYREQSLKGVSSNQPTTLADCTGLRYNCTSTTAAFRQGVIANSSGKVNVKEIGGEILVPVFADKPFFKSFDLTGAARYTDYSTSGGVTTWKAGIDWHISNELSFRGTRSRDIRAPTVYELFGPQQYVRSGYNDIQTDTTGTTTLVQGSNPNLKPEKADTYTLGAVFKPNWLPGFSVAVDYFNIQIRDAITVIDGRDATYQRQCIDSAYTSSFCGLYDRPISPTDTSEANYPTQVFANSLNAARVKTRGVDVDMNYKAGFFGGTWDFRLVGTYQPKYTQVVTKGSTVLNMAGVDGLPKYRVTGFIGYSTGPVSIDTQTTWHSSTKHSADPTIVYAYGNTPAKAFTDLTVTFDIDSVSAVKSQFFVNVSNLFDTSPGVYPAIIAGVPGFGPITTNGEDPVGRYFTVGVRAKF